MSRYSAKPLRVRESLASEDTHAVKDYFQRFRARRVQFIVLATTDGNSAPQHVCDRLDRFRKEYATQDDDQFWYCGDTDRWVCPGHIQNLTLVLQHCRQASYGIAISNPCFEFWLLLHFEEPSLSESATCRDTVRELSRAAAGYKKRTGCTRDITPDMVLGAVERAKSMAAAAEQIPSKPASQVFLIVEELLKRDSIDLS